MLVSLPWERAASKDLCPILPHWLPAPHPCPGIALGYPGQVDMGCLIQAGTGPG